MNETTSEKPPPLPLMAYSGRVKNKIINDLVVTKTSDRNKTGNNYDDKGNREFHVEELMGQI